MTVTAAEKKSVVGLRDLYIAEITQDDADAYAAETPQAFCPAVNASHKPKASSKTQYADDAAFDVMMNEGETEITLEVTNIPLELLALVLGREFDASTGRLFDNAGAVPPDMALSFRSVKSNGSYKYYQYLRGKFSIPEEEQATKGDSPDPKTIKIVFTAVKTTHEFDLGDINDGVKRVVGDEDISGFDGSTWFDAVQVPVAGSPAAFTCTPDPADAAADVVVTSNVVLTFSNALAGNAENGIVLTTVAGVIKACARTLSANRKEVTLNPTTNLSAGTQYLVIVPGVSDIYGQALADVVYDFTTAS